MALVVRGTAKRNSCGADEEGAGTGMVDELAIRVAERSPFLGTVTEGCSTAKCCRWIIFTRIEIKKKKKKNEKNSISFKPMVKKISKFAKTSFFLWVGTKKCQKMKEMKN